MQVKNYIIALTLLSCLCSMQRTYAETPTIDVVKMFKKELPADQVANIQLSGAFALYPMAVRWAEEFKKIYPKIRIDISAGGAGKGITDALTGMVDIGMVSRDVYKEEIDKGAKAIPVVKDAIVITMNKDNPLYDEIVAKGMTREKARELWSTWTKRTWGDLLGKPCKVPMHVYTRSDACGAAETFAAWMGLKQEDLEGTAVFGDPGITSVLQRDKVGIGYNNLAYAYDQITKKPYTGIGICPLDINGNGKVDPEESFYVNSTELNKAIADGIYPSPPARNLNFVVNSKIEITAATKEFIRFILTVGQLIAPEVAFVPLSHEECECELSNL